VGDVDGYSNFFPPYFQARIFHMVVPRYLSPSWGHQYVRFFLSKVQEMDLQKSEA
jgi:hypothetical protein